MLRALVPILGVAGCTAVYDAQYTDRAKELEEARVQVVSAEDRVSAITATDHRFYWVSNEKPQDQNLLHSIDQAGTRVDYEFTRGMSDILARFVVSDSLVVKCNSGTVTAFSAAAGNQMVDMTSMGSSECSVNGGDVYFLIGRKINRWRPGQGAPVQVVDMDAAGIGTASVGGFGAFTQTKMLLEEGGKLWVIDLTNGSAVWLENKDDAAGAVAFDAYGVVFETNKSTTSPEYLLYSDRSISFMGDKISNGGYDLNFEHGDVQNMQTTPIKVWLVNNVMFYRSLHGIFAYRFDTGKVIDVLLDGVGDSFDTKPRYGEPVVTLDNVLFVQDKSGSGGSSAQQPVYKVDLNARLK